MITDFQGFGAFHLASLITAALIGTAFIVIAARTETEMRRRTLRIVLALVILAVRSSRWVMDAFTGVFEWSDLLSLHICHINLILLLICLVKPNKQLFNICFLIGIPTALSVALFPGRIHPAPGIPRAMLFIMSHTMLVMGALYLAVVERMKPTLKMTGLIAAAGSLCLFSIYVVNKALGTNYLYLMKAPKGTALVLFEKLFGWPGYIFALSILAGLLMLAMLGIGQLINMLTIRHVKARRGSAKDSFELRIIHILRSHCMITINTYNSAMQEALVDCYETCLNALGWEYCPNTRHSDMVNIENVYMKNGCFWCLFDDEKLIGMVAIRCLDKARKIAELKRMFIFPGYQGKGYGNMLLKHSLNYAKSQGFRIVRLDTTKDRLAAVHLYEKYGFHRTEAYNDNIYAELYFELDLVDYRTEEYQ